MKVLHAFMQPRSRGGSLAATRATIASLEDRGVEIEVFTRDSRDIPATLVGRLSTAANAVYARSAVRQFKALLDESRPDLLHINELFPLISAWILPVASRRGIPVVMSVDDYHLTCPVRTHFRNGEVCTQCLGGREHRAVINNCRGSITESVIMATKSSVARRFRLYLDHVSHFVFPSEFTRSWMIEHLGIDEDRTSVIPYISEIPPTTVRPSRNDYIAFAGRFVPEKGIDVLLEAAKLCGLPVRLARNEHHFSSIELPESAMVVVTTGRDDLAEFYRGARMLIVPSVWFETYGLVGVEAMSHGVPIIVSDLGAVAALVDDGVHGYRFRSGDPADLAGKMRVLWDDPDLCDRMGASAREKVLANCTAEIHSRRMLDLYESLVERSSEPVRTDRAADTQGS